jgi:hypothetical protein
VEIALDNALFGIKDAVGMGELDPGDLGVAS